MDKPQDDPLVGTVRGQQHTGNHDKPPQEQGGADRFGGTRAGAENVESGGTAGPTYIVTGDEAREAGRDPQDYAALLADRLKPYGVTVRLAPDQPGMGGLMGCGDPKLEVDIRQAVALALTEGT